MIMRQRFLFALVEFYDGRASIQLTKTHHSLDQEQQYDADNMRKKNFRTKLLAVCSVVRDFSPAAKNRDKSVSERALWPLHFQLAS